MKDYSAALGFLEEVEGGKEYAELIRSHVSGINKEAQNWRQKAKGGETQIASVQAELNSLQAEVAGYKERITNLEKDLVTNKAESTNLQAKLTVAETELNQEKEKLTKINTDFTAAQAKVQELETEVGTKTKAVTTAESKAKSLERTILITDAASAIAAQPSVLRKLIEDKHNLVLQDNEAFIVEGEGEAAKNIPLREYADSHWKEFMPALFYNQSSPTTPRLPSGGPKGKATDSAKTKVRNQMNATYGDGSEGKKGDSN